MASSSSAAVAKQGAYGKVKTHKHSVFDQLSRPKELAAVFKLLAFGGPRAKRASEGVEAFLSPDAPLAPQHRECIAKLGHVTVADLDFCDLLLKKVSRSFAGVIARLPNEEASPLRLAIAIFYLVLRALDTVEDDMDLNAFKPFVTPTDTKTAQRNSSSAELEAKQRMLVKFYHYVLPSDSPEWEAYEPISGIGLGDEADLLADFGCVIRALQCVPKDLQMVVADITKEMSEGMAAYIARDLRQGTEDRTDFDRYCHIVAGTVGDGLTRMWGLSGYESVALAERRDLWDSMGIFLQKTNIIRDYLEDFVDARAFWPKSVWENYVAQPANGETKSLGALADTKGKQVGNTNPVGCLNHLITDSLELVPQCLEYLDNLHRASVISFCALPQVMAIATLAQCYGNVKVFTGVVKIRKGQAARMALSCIPASVSSAESANEEADTAKLRAGYLQWFDECAADIKSRVKKDDPNAQRTIAACDAIKSAVDARKGKTLGESSWFSANAAMVAVCAVAVTYVAVSSK